MILANRNGLKNTRNMLRVFGGLNETYSCTEAEYSAGINFSARNFPALSTRLPRRKLREEADLNGMYHLNGLLTVCGRDLVYTPDDTDEMEVTLKDAVENGRKTLVGIGTRILIFPDKLAFDTASRKVSALGAVWSGKNTSVEFAPCDAEGKVYEVSGCVVCWADRAAFRLAPFPGLRFWFFAVFNRILLSRSAPLGKRGVNILRLIGPDPRPQETGPDDVFHHLFQREPVFFIHRQQERRERHGHHKEHGPGVADGAAGQQVGRDAHRRRDPEAYKLAFRQVKGKFRLDL